MLLLLPMLLLTAPTAPRDSTSLQHRIEAHLRRLEAAGGSGVVLVAEGGHRPLVLAFGSADHARGTPVTPGTLFDIGSITKQFTAAAILSLEEHGRIQVSDSLGRFWPRAPADKRAITIHQLLTHTAGLPEAVAGDYEPLDREAFLARAFAAPLTSAPGRAYRYSNVGYSVLAAIVEVVTGEGYEAFLERALFRPAGMGRTGYRVAAVPAESIAVGYRGGQVFGRPTEQRWGADGPYWGLRGNGGLLSTAGDMYRWHQALEAGRVLSAESRRRAYTRHVEEGEGAGTWYGYGWALFPTPRGTTLVTHNGGNGAFFADFLRYLEEGVTIFVATNRATPATRQLGHAVARMVFDPGFIPPMETAPAPRALTELPADARGTAIREVLRALSDGRPEVLERMVATRFAPRLRDAVPMLRHLELLGRLGAQVRGRVIAGVTVDGDETAVRLAREGAAPVTLRVTVLPGDPTLIDGVGLED